VRVLQKMLASYEIPSRATSTKTELEYLLRKEQFQFILLSATLPDFPEVVEFPVFIDDWQQPVLRATQEINLIEQKEHQRVGPLHHLEHEVVSLREFSRHVHDQQNQFAAIQRFPHFRHHLPAKRSVGPMNSWRVNENDLAALPSLLFGHVQDSQDAVARSLRLGTDNGDLLAYQRIEQSGFAGVGPAQDADESGMKGHEK